MSYSPGQVTAAAFNALKSSVLAAEAAVSAATNAVAGTLYDCSGATAYALTLPAGPAAGAAVGVKIALGYTGAGVTVTPAAGTIDGAPNFLMATPGAENTFVYTGTQWDVT